MKINLRLFKLLPLLLVLLIVAPIDAQEYQTTLLLWDQYIRDVESGVMDQLVEEFEAAHPGLDIVREAKAYDDIRATIGRALSSADGPDVSQVNQGRVDMGTLVEAGLLLDLGAYAEQYGWHDFMSPGIVARNSFTPDGVTFGEGNLYGVPPTAELIGVYYNKQIFEEQGISVPETFEEFEFALAALAEAGITPIVFGSLDGWPAIHTYSEIQNQYVDMSFLDDFVYGRNDASFANPEDTEAAAKLQEWVEAGYFTPQFEGIGYDDSWRLFSDGQGAMMITGSWITGELAVSENADNFGFFLLPSSTAGEPKPTVGGTSMSFSISSAAEDPDLAAELIDWLVSDHAAELWVEAGFVPLRAVDPSMLDDESLFGDTVAAWNELISTDSVAHYLDWASPTMYDTITASLQELLALRVTPDEFVQQIEVDYGEYLQSLE